MLLRMPRHRRQRASACLYSPPRARHVCQDTCYHITHSVPGQKTAVNENPLVALHTSYAYKGDVQRLRGAKHQLAAVADRTTCRGMVTRAAIYNADTYGRCAGAYHQLRPRRFMDRYQRLIFLSSTHRGSVHRCTRCQIP